LSAVIQVQVNYAAELAARLRSEFPVATDDRIQEAIITVAQKINDEALRLVPVRTGYLRSTIMSESVGKWSFRIMARAYYAPYVEFGTRRMMPRLFMTHALMLHQTELLEEVENGVARAIQDTFL
jgi:HK97 gp10 family phage protein